MPAQNDQRSAQLVAGIVQELSLGRERLLQPVEHPVECRGQMGDVIASGDWDAAPQISTADLISGDTYQSDRSVAERALETSLRTLSSTPGYATSHACHPSELPRFPGGFPPHPGRQSYPGVAMSGVRSAGSVTPELVHWCDPEPVSDLLGVMAGVEY